MKNPYRQPTAFHIGFTAGNWIIGIGMGIAVILRLLGVRT